MTPQGCRGLLIVVFCAGPLAAADWPMWGGTPARNMASSETGLPIAFVPGEKRPDGSGIDLATTQNVRWTARLGSETYTCPAVAGGRVFICSNDTTLQDPRYPSTGGGMLQCFDERTGRLLWRLAVRKLTGVRKAFHKYSDQKMTVGICSTPTVDGDRVFLVTNRGEVLCLDVQGLANGNDGPYRDEAHYTNGADQPAVPLRSDDPDIVWRFDILTQLKVFPHDANCSSVLVHGDVAYVNTANGVDNVDTPYPDAPTLIALDKHTGRLLGYDDAKIGRRVFHGQWSSPALAEVDGKALILLGGGDGVCYAFAALSSVPEKPAVLPCVWSCDCNPPEYRRRDGQPIDYWDGDKRDELGNRNDGTYVGPSEIIATPVCRDGRVYVAIGQDPEHGLGRGCLCCIDATQTGDITRTGKLWTYQGLQRSLCTVGLEDDLLYIADVSGALHCLEAETGHVCWVNETHQETWTSLLVADGRVYQGTRKALWVLVAGRRKQVLGQIHLGTPVWSPPVAANGTLYVASQRYLWAAQLGNPAKVNAMQVAGRPSRDVRP